MKCPRCVQNIHRTASQCPHCGLGMADLDDLFGFEDVGMRKVGDAAGVLKLKERKIVKEWFNQFEVSFPQLFLSVYFGALDERANIREFGIWLLNRSVFEDLDGSKANNSGIILIVDVNSKAVFIAHGYLLDFYLREGDTFNILEEVHPHLLQGAYFKALKIIIKKLSVTLRRRSRDASKNPQKYQKLAGVPQKKMGEILQLAQPHNGEGQDGDEHLPLTNQ